MTCCGVMCVEILNPAVRKLQKDVSITVVTERYVCTTFMELRYF